MKTTYMDKMEVTNQQYYDFCIATNNPFPQFWGIKEFRSGTDFFDYPVVGLSYFEAEWEYAARGGMITMLIHLLKILRDRI